MSQVFGSCSRYTQGYGELNNLDKHTSWMGNNYLIVASKNRLRDLQDQITTALEGATLNFIQFDGECSWEEIHKLEDIVKEYGSEIILGIGGGKVADTTKVVAHTTGAKLVIIPTTAASDAYTSAASLIYKDGEVEDVMNFPKSPELVLVDTEVLIKSPVRLFVSGMGDALSTYIGGKICFDNSYDNHFNAKATHTGLNIGKLSYDLLFEYGRQAKEAAVNKSITKAYNTIVEVNILMSGLGFENSGSSSDHSFYFGTLALPDREEYVYHGEGVAFSICCLLVLTGASTEEIDKIYKFLVDVGLPVTFDDMHLFDLTEEEMDIMTKSTLSQPFFHNQPFEIDYAMVYGAYKTADAIGKIYKAGGSIL